MSKEEGFNMSEEDYEKQSMNEEKQIFVRHGTSVYQVEFEKDGNIVPIPKEVIDRIQNERTQKIFAELEKIEIGKIIPKGKSNRTISWEIFNDLKLLKQKFAGEKE